MISDEQLHTAVTAFAFEHAVNYSEAMQAVTEINRAQEYRDGDATQRGKTSPEDAAFHAEVTAYQHKKKVSYSEAARKLADFNQAQVANFSEATGRGHALRNDYELHRAVTDYKNTHAVSYSEALTACTSTLEDATVQPQNFSEAPASSAAKTALEGQEIEIFKAGAHVANDGRAHGFSVAVVVAMAAVYSPARHEAPLTLGHPDDNQPAYGWVKSLRATDDGRLMMRAGDLTPEFSEAVKAGRYKKRSASFYPPGAPNNPAPGNWYLRHVAWLGAHVPAVRGLADVNFGMTEAQDYPSFEF